MATSPVIAYSEENLPVRLDFDTWTPRPHFILVQTRPREGATPQELQASFEIVGRFLANNPKFDIDAILSFHCGKWYQQHTQKWHAHLCVPFEPYLGRAVQEIRAIPSNREWNRAGSVEQGIRLWNDRKRETYNGYKNDCLRNASSVSSVIPVNLSSLTRDSYPFRLAWACATPRIAVLLRSSDTMHLTLADLYNFLSDIRINAERELQAHDRSFKDFGCHLCLYVRGQNAISLTTKAVHTLTDTGDIQSDSRAVGYIQMDENLYVKWLPPSVRRIWLPQFQEAPHFVST